MESFERFLILGREAERIVAGEILGSGNEEIMTLLNSFSVSLRGDDAFVHIAGEVLGRDDLAGTPNYIYTHEKTAVGVESALVADEIAERIENGHIANHFCIFHHMRVTADDEVEPFVNQPFSQIVLLLIGLEQILYAPMDSHDAEVDCAILNGAEVGGNLGRVDQVDGSGREGLVAVAAVGTIKEGDAQPLYVDNQRITCSTIFGRTVGTHVGTIAKQVERAFQSATATVEDMVVSQHEDIEAGIPKGIEVGIRCGEIGITGIGLPGESHLKVDDREVGPKHKRPDISEVRLVIVGVGSRIVGPLELGAVSHSVTSEKERDSVLRKDKRGAQKCANKQFQLHGRKFNATKILLFCEINK